MRVEITGAHIVDPKHAVDDVMDVFLADGRVLAVGARPDGFEAADPSPCL